MKAVVLILTASFLFVLVGACGGRELVPDCHGDVYCHWDPSLLPVGAQSEMCCPSAYPYCGEPHTNCPVGKCCNAPPQ